MATPTTIRYQQQATGGTTALSGAGATLQIFPAQQIVGPSSGLPTVVGGGGTRNLCNYLTDLVVTNSNATSSLIEIFDGSTIIFCFQLIANGTGVQPPIHFTTPLKGSPNTNMSIRQASNSAAIWNALGFVASQAG